MIELIMQAVQANWCSLAASPARLSPAVAAMAEQTITLQSLSRAARQTTETPPRIAVYDVIAAAKGCAGSDAGKIFRRMLQAGTVPWCGEVLPDFIKAASHGGARGPVVVATAQEMVQILWALPGTSTFRKNCLTRGAPLKEVS